jgi:UDP-hydrolysing UDP-N-acetyl-D-glucosamine 2-epimerase
LAERKVCVVTGSRADYGLLRWLMEDVRADPAMRLQLVVTGAHLSPAHGETWRDIAADGFAIDAKVDLGLGDYSPAGVAAAAGRCVAGMGEAFAWLRPDIVVLQGDRYEIAASAVAAALARVPIAHTHGGELTEGAVDDALRHAITKMAALHFVAAPENRRRIVQMGEGPARVFVVGDLGLDWIARLDRLDRAALEADLGLTLDGTVLLVTYHPETLGRRSPAESIANLLAALGSFPAAKIVFTGVNADAGRDAIDGAIRGWVAANRGRAVHAEVLGQRRYLSLMALASAVVGNSSSGLIEAPAMGVPTVNIGDRQMGRPRRDTVIDCVDEAGEIDAAIARAIAMPKRAPGAARPGAARAICRVLREVDLATLARKRFHDLPAEALA